MIRDDPDGRPRWHVYEFWLDRLLGRIFEGELAEPFRNWTTGPVVQNEDCFTMEPEMHIGDKGELFVVVPAAKNYFNYAVRVGSEVYVYRRYNGFMGLSDSVNWIYAFSNKGGRWHRIAEGTVAKRATRYKLLSELV